MSKVIYTFYTVTYKGLSTIVNLFKQERDMYEQNTWTLVLHQLINDDPLKIALLNKKFINGDYIPAFRELIESWIGFQSINATFNTLVAILKLEIGLYKLASKLHNLHTNILFWFAKQTNYMRILYR